MLDYALYIGRFQPIHNGHLASIKYGLSIAKNLIIVLGSYQLAPSFINPWTAMERKKMILSVLSTSEKKRVQFIFLRDRLYNEDLWKENLIREVEFLTHANAKIGIIGHIKDHSSYYLKIFPQWQFIETGNFYNLNSTDFRENYFSSLKPKYDNIPNGITLFLKKFRKGRLFKVLQQEKELITLNPPQFLKKESYLLLIVGNYLLLKKRLEIPGKNLYSLPYLNEVNLSAYDTKYFVTKRCFYQKTRDNFLTQEKEVFFYRIPFSVISHKLINLNKTHHWSLLDDLCLMENQMYLDYYQMIRLCLF